MIAGQKRMRSSEVPECDHVLFKRGINGFRKAVSAMENIRPDKKRPEGGRIQTGNRTGLLSNQRKRIS
jgi:hypothetical protein